MVNVHEGDMGSSADAVGTSADAVVGGVDEDVLVARLVAEHRGLGDGAVVAGRELGVEQLVAYAGALGPDPDLAGLDDEALVRRFVVQGAQLAAASARWLGLLAELVVRGVWADQGARTPGAWLSWKVGMAPSTAREHVRVALRLRELPLIRARFAAGELSYCKVRALTRIAVPGTEQLLVGMADAASGAQLDRIVRAVVAGRRAAGVSEQQREASRGLRVRHEADGDVTVSVKMSAEDAQTVLVLLERLVALELAAQHGDAADDAADADGAAGDAADAVAADAADDDAAAADDDVVGDAGDAAAGGFGDGAGVVKRHR